MERDSRPPALDPTADRAELIAAWREHRRERRKQTGAEGSATPDGFLLRKWRHAGVYGMNALERITALLQQLLSDPDGEAPALERATDVVRRALDGDPTPQLVDAVRTFLEAASPAEVADALLVIHEAQVPWLSPVGSLRLDFLTGHSDGVPRDEVVPSPSEDPSAAFALAWALRSGTLARFSAEQVARVVPWAPAPVLDDLIDCGLVTAVHAPWRSRVDDDEPTRAYWRARLVPDGITLDEAETLDWTAALQRLDFLDGERGGLAPGSLYDLLGRAADGDDTALKPLEELLPRPLVLRLRQIADGRLTGNWEPDILHDHALWQLMAVLWEPRTAIDPRRGPFYELRALNHAYDLILRQDHKQAAAQLRKLAAYESGSADLRDEAWNMLAYLALVEENLEQALGALAQVTEADQQAAQNAELIHRRREVPRNLRPHPANPYLELGLPHGYDGDWKAEYRKLRMEHHDDAHEAARLNRAMKGLEQADKAEDWSGFFVLPLHAPQLDYPRMPPASLVPPLQPIERRTPAIGETDVHAVRDRALPILLPTLLSTPRRPDHQHGTPRDE